MFKFNTFRHETFIDIVTIILLSFNNWAQSFTVQSNSIMLNGSPNVQDFNDNTYLDALSTETLTWSIVADSMPSSWEFLIVFLIATQLEQLMAHLV